MKKQKKEEKQKIIWKIVAIAVIAIFGVLIIGGLIKAHYIRSSFVKPTQAQIDYAAKIATEKLQSMGENVSAFQIQTGKRMRTHKENGVSRTIIQVSFSNNSTTHIYLVDVNSGEVLLHSETETFVPFWEHKKKLRGDEHKFLERDGMKYKGLKP